jgi:hypothetical protein
MPQKVWEIFPLPFPYRGNGYMACICLLSSNFRSSPNSVYRVYREKNKKYLQIWLECARQCFDGIFWK